MVRPANPSSTPCPDCGALRPADLASGLCVTCVGRHLQCRLQPGAERTAVPADLPAGFEFLDTLGRGGMGVVHLVFEPRLKRYVALKQIAAAWRDHAGAKERFLMEAQAAAKLSHPGIVPILAMGVADESAWYTMEHVEGGDLAHRLAERGGRLPWPEAVALVAQVAEALDHAHQAGIAHRDVKPSNILLGASDAPKLADFGVARMVAAGAATLTRTGEILGTPHYLAPECVGGGGAGIDARPADVYSLSAVLFHLIAGRPPYTSDTPILVLHAIQHEPVPRLRDSGAEVPAWLDALCAQGLAKDRAERPASARDLAVALRQQRMPPRRFWRRRHVSRRTRVALALVAVLALGGVLASRFAGQEPPPAAAQHSLRVAVLPLAAAAGDTAATAVASGLQDDLVSTLLRLTDVRVIAASSVQAAQAGGSDFRAAKERLRADLALTGSIHRSGEFLRFQLQLVATGDGTTVWAKRYDRRETDLFNLQTDLATDVALQLHAHLQPDASERAKGTASTHPEAQRLYFAARTLAGTANRAEKDLRQAAGMLAEATRLDPEFALAFAQQSMVETRLYLWGHDRTPAILERALAAAQQALRLNPRLAEGETALGLYYYRRSRDYATALARLEKARALAPHHAEVQAAIASIERRRGEFERAAVHYRLALDLDPLNSLLAYNAADTFVRLHRYEEAEKFLLASLKLQPASIPLRKLRGDLYMLWKGDLGPMAEDLATRPPDQPSSAARLLHQVDLLTLEDRVGDALAVLRASTFDVLDGESAYINREGYEALLLQLLGESTGAKVSAARALARLAPALERQPNAAPLLLHAAQMKAILGEFAESDALIKRTLTPGDPACVDAFDRAYFLGASALCLASSGRDDEARPALRAVLAARGQFSAKYIALHPALKRFAKDFP